MTIGLDEVTAILRRKLLAGEFAPGMQLREAAVADVLKVSRTISRLAMGALEHEGLLERERNRGFRTRAFSIDEIADAIEVRAELEAMAVRLASERGLSGADAAGLEALVAAGTGLLATGMTEEARRAEWVTMNTDFHDTMIAAAANRALKIAIDQISKTPLASAASIIFDRVHPDAGLIQLKRSHEDHVEILAAVMKRQGQRAGMLMREHSFRSARNKRVNLSDAATLELARLLPGGALIVHGEAAPRRRRSA